MDNLAFLDTAVEVLRILIAEPASGLVFLGVFVMLYLLFSNRTVKFFLSLACTTYVFGFLIANGLLEPLVGLVNRLISRV